MCALGALTRIASADLIQDGGFESAPIGNYTGALGDGWLAAAGIIQVHNIVYGAVPHSGSRFAYLNYGYDPNTLTQTFATTPGQDYLLTYYVADTVDSRDLLTVVFGSQTVYSGIAPHAGVDSPDEYVLLTAAVTATTATTSVSFTGIYQEVSAEYGTIIDDVSVTLVPTPATSSLLCLEPPFPRASRRRRLKR